MEIREGGLALIRVADNGGGIEPGELRLAFERHATSKVAAEEDLWRVPTLGFRGEALPSIAAAGEVELISRVAGQRRRRPRPAARRRRSRARARAPPRRGRSFSVRGSSAAQPARLKFVRAPAQRSDAHLVRRQPLRHGLPGGAIRADASTAAHAADPPGRRASRTPWPPSTGRGRRGRDRGGRAAGARGEPGVRGVAVEPRLHRASRNYIGLYVNRRWVRNRALAFAVEEAYQGMLPVGRHPIAVLDLRMPPDEVDVNVHPTKAEVRLRNERRCSARAARGAGRRRWRGAGAGGGARPGAVPSVPLELTAAPWTPPL